MAGLKGDLDAAVKAIHKVYENIVSTASAVAQQAVGEPMDAGDISGLDDLESFPTEADYVFDESGLATLYDAIDDLDTGAIKQKIHDYFGAGEE